MPNRSQRHLLDTRGRDSAGNIKALGRIVNDKCMVASGANTAPAKIQFGGFLASGKSVSVTVQHNTTSATVSYTATGAEETAATVAAGLAAAIEADATVGGLVTATAGAATVSVVNQVLTNGDTVTLSGLTV